MNIKKHSYSENIFNKRILIFGPKTPPIGGVSVHIERLCKIYEKNNNLIKIFDCTSEIIGQNKISYMFKIFKTINNFGPDIIDYHTSFLKFYIPELFVLVFLNLFFRFKINIVDHDPRYLYKKNYLDKKILNFLLKFVNNQVIIGSSTYQSYLDNKIKIKNNCSIESPFLPPDSSNLENLLKFYPQDLLEFIKFHETIILMNAFKISLLDNGKDLYGIDRAIDLMNFLTAPSLDTPVCAKASPGTRDERVKTNFSCSGRYGFRNRYNAGLVLLYQSHDSEYFKVVTEKIEKLGLKNNIYLLCGNYLLWPLFSKSTIFIRPTISDSYGISIEESLFFGVPAIASDVCQRPKGTILFDINNEKDFYSKVYNFVKLKKGQSNERNFNKRDIMHQESSR